MRNILFVTLVLLSCKANTQPSDELADVVKTLASEIRANYVLEKEAHLMADLLDKNLSSSQYNSYAMDTSLSNRLQKDLRSIIDDKHLRIRYGNNPPASRSRYSPAFPHGVGDVSMLEGRIALFSMSHFPSPNNAYRKKVQQTMDQISSMDAQAVIIDMRENRGGSPAGVQLVCSYFLPPELLLNSLYFRNRDHKEDFYTLKVSNPMLDIPVVLLTSELTFSGGEEFCYNLKNLSRATLIGEVTGGGAHPVNRYALPQGFAAIIPIGMAISPITETNWEGVGVQPDIQATREDALNMAIDFLKE